MKIILMLKINKIRERISFNQIFAEKEASLNFMILKNK